jgi:hypothetical protein
MVMQLSYVKMNDKWWDGYTGQLGLVRVKVLIQVFKFDFKSKVLNW